MKLERNIERKYSIQVMSTTTTTTTTTKNGNSDLQDGFCWFLSWKVFIVEPVIFWTFLNAHSVISKLLTFAGLANLASHQIETTGSIIHQGKTLPFQLPIKTHFIDSLLLLLIQHSRNVQQLISHILPGNISIIYQKQCNLIVAWIA